MKSRNLFLQEKDSKIKCSEFLFMCRPQWAVLLFSNAIMLRNKSSIQ